MSLPLSTSASHSMLSSSTGASTAFSQSMKYSFKLSLSPSKLCEDCFICVENLRDVRATAWCPSTAQHHLFDPNWDQPESHTLRVLHFRRPRRRSVQARKHNWPASRRLARTALATLSRTHHRNHCRCARRYITSTDHCQFYPPWRQGHGGAQLLERLADVSLVVRWSFHCDSAPWLRTGRPRAAHHCGMWSGCVGAGLRGSSSQLLSCSRLLSSCLSSPGARFPSASSGSTSERRRARLGPSASSGLTLALSPISWSSASVADFVPATPNKGNHCVHGFAQSYS